MCFDFFNDPYKYHTSEVEEYIHLKLHPPDLFTLQAFQVEIKTRLCQWLEVGGKTSQNNSVEHLPPISLELAPKKVKSNNRGFGVYQLAQTGEARYLRGFQLVRASLVRF